MVGLTTIKEISKVWDGITLAAATKNKLKNKKQKKKHEFRYRLVPLTSQYRFCQGNSYWYDSNN